MTPVAKINLAKWALGGFVAGIIMFLLTGVLNGLLLNGQFEVWSKELGGLRHPPSQAVAMIFWTLMSYIFGFVGVWIYAAIRPHFGAGPKTAFLAAFALWLVSKLAPALDFFALGILPTQLVLNQLIGSFVIMVIAIMTGAWLYKE